MHKSLLLITLMISIVTNAQQKTDTLLEKILINSQHDLVTQVLRHANEYRLQIIYTQINRTRNNKPVCTNYYYNYDPTLYFNPASTVKMPLAFLALEKLNKMKVPGVHKYTAVQFDSSYEKQTTQYTDSTSENLLPSIAHYI